MQGNNSYLKAFMLIRRMRPLLMPGKRGQISRASLMTLRQGVSCALEQFQRLDEKPSVVVYGSAVGVIEVIEVLLSEETCTETDTESKEVLLSKLDTCIEAMYMDIAKYYMNHDFDLDADPLDTVLQDIIDTCIERGYYFGEDLLIEEERKHDNNGNV